LIDQQLEEFVSGDFDDEVASEDEERSRDVYDIRDEGMEDGTPELSPEYDISAKDDNANRLGRLLPLHPRFDDSSMRTFRTLLNEPNMLATYRPSLSTSPLTDPRTARIFAHFVSATGPSLSIFERHPTGPSVMFTEGPVPKARQSLWTYTIPTLALTHPALMQAVLAISSLHIAKLQGGSTVSSLKHYHVSIMRLKKCVGLPLSRSGIGTLAATLLLGFYEVIAGEHSKWNSHLLGAKQLLQEIDFTGMTGWLKFTKAQEKSFAFEETYPTSSTSLALSYARHKVLPKQILEAEDGVDEYLISKLMGRNVSGNSSRVDKRVDHGSAHYRRKAFTVKELEDFQVRQDLYWWYCKQDVFQSILSGNRLL
jgi:Fungal specific transcription factor domain